jgi:hypothetical protein
MNNYFREAIITALESSKAREHRMSLLSDFEHEKVFICEDCKSTLIIKENLTISGMANKIICKPKVEDLAYYMETDERFVERYIN